MKEREEKWKRDVMGRMNGEDEDKNTCMENITVKRVEEGRM